MNIPGIICDTSSLILLYKAGLSDYLVSNYEVIITDEVNRELCKDGYAGGCYFKGLIINGNIRTVNSAGTFKTGTAMDMGELTVLESFIFGAGECILMDDGRGARYCRDNGLPYVNALLVIRSMFLRRRCSESFYEAKFDWFSQWGRYSRSILDWAGNAQLEDIPYL